MKGYIRLGDPTSHGGTVLSANPRFTVGGKGVACLGDDCTCPLHGPCKIAEGLSHECIDGKPVALHGHKTSCGATLISTLVNHGSSEG